MNYLLIGNEYYNLRKRKNELLSGIQQSDLNVIYYNDASESAIDEIVNDCQTVPFFADKKVIVCTNPLFIVDNKNAGKDDLNKIINYLREPTDTTELIIYVEKNMSLNQNALKQLIKYLNVEKYDALNEEEFTELVKKDLKDAHVEINNAALNLLLKRLPLNVENWKSELNKLCIYDKPLDKEAINSLVCRQLEKDAFALTKAINKKNLVAALQIFHDLLTINKSDLLGLLALVAIQFRTMSQYKILQEMGNTNNDIAQKMNVSAGSVYYKLKECDGRNSGQLLNMLNELALLDQNIKSGKIDPVLGMELFIVKAVRSS
ncbi:MAG: DNA polymerase III subunit delta [Erysipelotrichia bacterium]|nr:DNA polymerase III subunit delta [Erysipelotrichia bacterium]